MYYPTSRARATRRSFDFTRSVIYSCFHAGLVYYAFSTSTGQFRFTRQRAGGARQRIWSVSGTPPGLDSVHVSIIVRAGRGRSHRFCILPSYWYGGDYTVVNR